MMKKQHVLCMLTALVFVACAHRERPFDPFEGGPTTAEVQQQMANLNVDRALVMRTADCQYVCYMLDSLTLTAYEYYDGSNDTVCHSIYDSRSAMEAWEVSSLSNGRWRLRFKTLPSWLLNITMDDVSVTTEGVEFNVRLYGKRAAHCTLITTRPDLSTTSLFTLPELQPLLTYAIVSLLLDEDIIDDIINDDEWEDDEDGEEDDWFALWPDSPDTDSIAAHNDAIEQLATIARNKGWEVNYEQYDDKPMRGLFVVHDKKKNHKECCADITLFSTKAQQLGINHHVRLHHGRGHRKCCFRCY